jgi:hypothetical protein
MESPTRCVSCEDTFPNGTKVGNDEVRDSAPYLVLIGEALLDIINCTAAVLRCSAQVVNKIRIFVRVRLWVRLADDEGT